MHLCRSGMQDSMTLSRNLDTEPAFYSAYTALDMSGAQWMTENKPEIRLIGIDYLSVTAYEGITASHHHLLATVCPCGFLCLLYIKCLL